MAWKADTYGYYSPEFKRARLDLMNKRSQKKARREGNFVEVQGRLIYAL